MKSIPVQIGSMECEYASINCDNEPTFNKSLVFMQEKVCQQMQIKQSSSWFIKQSSSCIKIFQFYVFEFCFENAVINFFKSIV